MVVIILGVAALIAGFERFFVSGSRRPVARGRSFLSTTAGRIVAGFALAVALIYVIFVASVSGGAS